ncbi:MAG: hypothetical protein OXC10_07060 [Rhodospirillaceae bacterium]|nr:hypothetical protein [Rhodospirillaceae bacterium]
MAVVAGMKKFKIRRLEISVNVFRFYAAVSIYALACVLYIVFVPLAAKYFEEYDIVWPLFSGALVYDLIIITLATIIPTIIGVLKFSVVREGHRSVSIQFRAKALVAAFLLSFAINIALLVEIRVEYFLDMLNNTDSKFSGFFGWPEILYILCHSLIPPTAILLHSFANLKNDFGLLSLGVAVAAVTLGHILSYAVYELLAKVEWRYYWHQGFLAFIFSVASFGGLKFYISGADLEN